MISRPNTDFDNGPSAGLPPHSMEAEQGILGCILLEPVASMVACVESMHGKAEAFYDLRHRRVYEAIMELRAAKRAVDLVSVPTFLRDRHELEHVGGLAYLSGLQDGVMSVANLPEYIRIVNEKFLARKCLQIAESLKADVWRSEEVGGVVGRASKALAELASAQGVKGEKFVRVGEYYRELVNEIEDFHHGRKRMHGLSTGLFYLDNMMCGLRPEKLIVVGGRPGTGKTQLAMQITEQVAVEERLPVGWFSIEMSARELAQRLLFMKARVDPIKFKNGFLVNGEADKRALLESVVAGKDAPVHILDSAAISLDRLQIHARRAVLEFGLRLMVVDYLQLLAGWEGKRYQTGATGNEAKIADAMGLICALKKETGIPWLVLSQLNDRDLDMAIRTPTMGDLKGSGTIEQAADAIWLLQRLDMRKCIDKAEGGGADAKTDKAMRWFDGDNIQKLPQGYRDDWPKYLTRIDLLVEKQRDGGMGKCELVRVNPWQRFIEPYRDKGHSGSSTVRDSFDGPPVEEMEGHE
jgi:replicative DNA helicase